MLWISANIPVMPKNGTKNQASWDRSVFVTTSPHRKANWFGQKRNLENQQCSWKSDVALFHLSSSACTLREPSCQTQQISAWSICRSRILMPAAILFQVTLCQHWECWGWFPIARSCDPLSHLLHVWSGCQYTLPSQLIECTRSRNLYNNIRHDP